MAVAAGGASSGSGGVAKSITRRITTRVVPSPVQSLTPTDACFPSTRISAERGVRRTSTDATFIPVIRLDSASRISTPTSGGSAAGSSTVTTMRVAAANAGAAARTRPKSKGAITTTLDVRDAPGGKIAGRQDALFPGGVAGRLMDEAKTQPEALPMTASRYHWSTILFLTALGCGGQAEENQGALLVTTSLPPGDKGTLIIGGSVPAWAGNLWVKANGKHLVYYPENTPPLEIAGGHDSFSISLPPTTYELELVNRVGQTLLRTGPIELQPAGVTFVWVHDSPSGLVAEVPDVTPDADPSTVQIRVSNVSNDERVIFSRCLGHADCPYCNTVPLPGQSDFASRDCTTLTTVAPGETWSSLQPIASLAPVPRYDSSCIAVQLEGQALAPVCAADLNSSSLGFQDVVDLFIDGLSQTTEENPDGSLIGKQPGIFPYGSKFF